MHSLGLLAIVLCCHYCPSDSIGLREEFTWSRITFATTQTKFHRPANGATRPNEAVEFGGSAKDINSEYIFENNIPRGANRWKDKLFITVPRWRLGVPSTLNYVLMNNTERHNVPLIPYPDLETNALIAPEGKDHIISVYRPAVDVCDRLWMVDSGVVDNLGNITRLGPQRIIIIDLNTDKIIKTYEFKQTDLKEATSFAMTAVDVTPDHCDDAYAYFPDLFGYGLVVYSLKLDDSWRVNHNYFYLESHAGEFNIAGFCFQWDDGAFSAALTDIKSDGFRDVIFHSMAGTHLHSVSTRILRDKGLATRTYHGHDFKILGDRGPRSQTGSSDLHIPTKILFLAMVNQNAVGCWNTNKPFHPKNFGIIQSNETTMIYPSDLKIYKDEIIVMTNSMPVYMYSSLDYDKTNFRVWMNNVRDAVKHTVCDV